MARERRFSNLFSSGLIKPLQSALWVCLYCVVIFLLVNICAPKGGELWKKVSEAEKKKYQAAFLKDSAKYEKEKEKYAAPKK